MEQPRLFSEEKKEGKAEMAEKAEYKRRLQQKLHDHEFRRMEGFPIGENEDILELSEPPYYTICPNPFLPEIVDQWQAERLATRREIGLPNDNKHDGNSDSYHREPFASDISEGKSDVIYRAHSYHTKVPHKAIMRYILHYTDPGDIVFDGFCGSGMTGVAAQLCGDRQEVESLGYVVDEKGNIFSPEDLKAKVSKLGVRKAVLNDLSPAATFIAHNYNTSVDVDSFEQEAMRFLGQAKEELGWMYETWHPHCDEPERVKGNVMYTVWSAVLACPECGTEMVYWDMVVNPEGGKLNDSWHCPECNNLLAKNPSKKSSASKVEKVFETHYDQELGQAISQLKNVPVLINYSIGGRGKRYQKKPDNFDYQILQECRKAAISYWYPTNPVPEGDKTGDPLNAGLTNIHHFYPTKALTWLAYLFAKSANNHRQLWPIFSMVNTNSKMYRYVPKKPGYKGQGGGVLSNTLYIPALVRALSVPSSYGRAIAKTKRAYKKTRGLRQNDRIISTGSSSKIKIDKPVFDYIFVDPPFGGNLMYSELSILWESWLRVMTNSEPEAIVNKTQNKSPMDYQRLMEKCFSEFYRLLRSGRWITVEFHNTQSHIWNVIQEALLRAGFVVADVRTIDKRQGTFNQITATGAVKQDLVISAYKPRSNFEKRFLEEFGTLERAWKFIGQHLAQLPVVVDDNGIIETLSERQDYLLFDRMIAFHIQRGVTVPMSASEFYAGLRERFIERDGMFFLPEQAPEYDKARLQSKEVAQLSLFVNDEKSSIQWLRQQLAEDLGGYPRSYQDIQPKFLRQLHQARHEALPELNSILEENFLQDAQACWYVPDPNKASDLEKLRQRALLREFNQYRQDNKKLRQFRSEAVRAGFAHAWQNNDYATIIQVAERLQERVLQEDPELLMYYDNASLRV